ncbi:MAG TPA: hypothetical protein VGQ38_15585 [Gaiellaceae bacterium]|nr:hypothetical protein [Gaiellaceae bacterium]
MNVAALYIDPRGPYPALGVDCWDESRDARLYDGPNPVVAHPPCGPWGKLRHLYRGAEHDCAPRALEQVRAFGGVLEHPAGSQLWRYAELPAPALDADGVWHPTSCGKLFDRFDGFTIEVEQVRWGHVARKSTWLYLVGVELAWLRWPPPRDPTHWTSGGRTMSTRTGAPVPPGIKVCSAQQRRRTPLAFARYLVSLAEAVLSNQARSA